MCYDWRQCDNRWDSCGPDSNGSSHYIWRSATTLFTSCASTQPPLPCREPSNWTLCCLMLKGAVEAAAAPRCHHRWSPSLFPPASRRRPEGVEIHLSSKFSSRSCPLWLGSLHASFLVSGSCLVLLLSDGEGVGWICFLHNDSDEDEGDNYGISNLLGMMAWRLRFLNDDIKAEMMLPPCNNFF